MFGGAIPRPHSNEMDILLWVWNGLRWVQRWILGAVNYFFDMGHESYYGYYFTECANFYGPREWEGRMFSSSGLRERFLNNS